MKQRILSLLTAAFIALVAQAEVKYVFYFIGDGMGVNQINVTETYLAALKGKIGFEPICMASFPVVGLVNTYSATNGVTDSAAGGTALACGKKTKNGAIGVLEDLETPVTSIAVWAQKAGKAVGVATNVAITHATPASFYGHQPSRQMYYELGQDLCRSGFDFFAGCDFHTPNTKAGEPTLREQATAAGYTILTGGYKEFQKKGMKADKLILFQSDYQNEKLGSDHIPYALDQDKNDLTLEQITRAGISYLMSKQKDGFFFQIEGGMIDYACHRNDIGNAINEVLDMDRAVKVAYEFYLQHPDETIIVISADHETGGLVMGRGPYELHTDLLRYQRKSIDELKWMLQEQYKKSPKKFTKAAVEKQLKDLMGFGSGITLDEKQQQRLDGRWNNVEKAISAASALPSDADADARKKAANDVKARISDMCETVKHIISEQALISWASGGHSNGYVPVYAVGPSTEVFQGRIDNIEIAPAMARIAGYTIDE
ncbi:MAG: alkaline phosphatase [Bacteroidaceae bacterium]|nr:alkaline phosphatase [Bacteroidaceae bacterium]